MTSPLNFVKMSEMYRKRLGVDTSKAKKLAEITDGYAYAFQELGVISFKHKDWSLEELEDELKTELYAYAWTSDRFRPHKGADRKHVADYAV